MFIKPEMNRKTFSTLSKEEKDDIIDSYAYRTHKNCVKYDQINQLLGGWYDWHPCCTAKAAKYIYKDFKKWAYNHKNKENVQLPVDTLDFVEYESENKQYIIQIVKTPEKRGDRSKVGINAGLLLLLPDNLGYVRIFSMPCK